MKIIAFIPARYESSRFPGKPLALIAGKPMIQHVYLRAISCSSVSRVIVATDDERISDCVQGFGGDVILTEREHHTGTDRVAEAARKIGLRDEDIAINIQGDQPLFNPESITHLLSPLLRDPSLLMSTLVYKMSAENEIQDPRNVKVVADREGFALYFSRSAIPYFRDSRWGRIYLKHLGFYAYRMGFLQEFASLPVGDLEDKEKLEQLRALEYGHRIKVIETPHDSIEVDSPKDIEEVEALLERS
ncbi:MAG: 3-deoxy-manno-octulosonate cytidylyltransferase [Deltaproteobacteria bacterium]|nr:3-deoxy-manno-octulosonate cytidylyltransferase [Deltaproteobacteria bacterium]